MHNQSKAMLYGLATVLIWSTVASAFKIALRGLDPLQLLLVACASSLVSLAVVQAFRGGLAPILALPRREVLRCALLGLVNPFLYYIVLFQAYNLLPAQEAQPLNYTWAITLSLLSVPLLGQKLSGRDLLAILVSYMGVVLISTHGDPLALHFSSLPGVGLALGSTLLWALYWIGNARQQGDPVACLLLNFLFALPCVAAATLLFSTLPGLGPAPQGATSLGTCLLAAVYVGVFEMGVTFVLWLTALKLTTSSARVANLIFLSPFLSLVFIHFLVGEDILPSTITGLGFIIAGNALMQLGRGKG